MESNGHHQQLEAGSRRQPQRQEAFVAGDGGSRAAARPRRPRVVRAAVDEDLYKVPSDMLRKKKGVPTLPFVCSSLRVVSSLQALDLTCLASFTR